MKLFKSLLLGSAILGSTDAVRRGRKRTNLRAQAPVNNYNYNFDDMMQGDDPFAGNRGPRPNERQEFQGAGKSADSSMSFNEECEEELPPECPEPPACDAEIKQENCTCDCNEEPPPKCNIDVMVLIDVCSCSPEVWAGIKSYIDSLVTKYQQEIGLSEEEVNVAIVGFANTVKTMVPFGDPVSYDYKKLTEDDGAINKMNIEPFTSQGTYIDKALAHVIDEFQNARQDSKKVLVSLTDGYNHPRVDMGSFERSVDKLIDMEVSIHSVARSPYTNVEDCDGFVSSNRREVCKKRANVLKTLNNDDDQIFVFQDARSTHDIIQASEEMCPEPPQKSLHCECTCELPQGCPGAPGVSGDRGGMGKAGPVGLAGDDGPPGEPGADGPKGPSGDPGPDGSPGIDGPPGEPGRDARHGMHGMRGTDGPQGEPGLKGPPGPSGETGDNGPQGVQGDQGIKGKTGMPGPPGKQGAPKMVNMGALKDAVFAILDELKPGGEPLPAADLERILAGTR